MTEQAEMWAVVELMGHVQLSGRIQFNSMMLLWQIDIPEGDEFTTQMFGNQSIYRIRIVSEDIARVYARKELDIYSYDEPIITREQHELILDQARAEIQTLRDRCRKLESRLTSIAVHEPHLLEGEGG